MNVSAAKDAINTYFPSEASEMYILIASSVALIILGIIFLTVLHGRFSQIFGVGLLVLALIYGSTGISLLSRDGANQARLNAALDAPITAETKTLLAAEETRIKTVVENYRNLQYMFAGFAAVSIALILFWPTQIGMALAAVGMTFAVSGVLVDHYSEKRATLYHTDLKAALSQP